MQKTFKKAFACLLAVLMVITCIPTAVFAATPRQWWVDDGVALEDIKAEPDYYGYNSYDVDKGWNAELGAWALEFGAPVDFKDDPQGHENHINDYKPVLGVTVSDQTTQNEYYGYDASHTYDAVKAAGNILNPADLKAGQRIVVTLELGGFDMLSYAQIFGNYNKTYLAPASYVAGRGGKITWTKQTTSAATAVIKNGTSFYSAACSMAGANINPNASTTYGTFIINATGASAINGSKTTSNFIGYGKEGSRPFGKYGIVMACFSFEVLADCNLKDAITFPERRPGSEMTFIQPYEGTTDFGTNAVYAFGSEGTDTVANIATIWSDYSNAKGFDVTVSDYNVNGNVPGTVTMTVEGESPVDIPAAGSTQTVTENKYITLNATPAEGYKFMGWRANNGTTVSANTEFTTVVNATVTYTPCFAIDTADTFTVTFYDAFENIVSVQAVTNGSQVIIPAVPARAGYTDGKWSLTNDQIAALTEDTVVTPKYTKETKNYTVTVPSGSTIAVGTDAAKEVTSVTVPYNTQVTVSNPSAATWYINDAPVAYGNTYTFYVGTNVTLTYKTDAVSVETPVVGSVGVEVNGTRVSFLATRKIQTAAGCVQVNAGFIYGTDGVNASTELVDVNGTSVKAVYTKTDAEQYSISFTVTPGKTYNGKAFITYKTKTNEINVAYANLQTHTAV